PVDLDQASRRPPPAPPGRLGAVRPADLLQGVRGPGERSPGLAGGLGPDHAPDRGPSRGPEGSQTLDAAGTHPQEVHRGAGGEEDDLTRGALYDEYRTK